MPTWTDENGEVVASTTFTDAQGRRAQASGHDARGAMASWNVDASAFVRVTSVRREVTTR